MIVSRILLIPVIAAIGYEILRFGARHRGNPVVKVLLYPGLLVQMITTKQTDRRHDRGRDRLDGGGARRRRRSGPDRFGRLRPRPDEARARRVRAAMAGARPPPSTPTPSSAPAHQPFRPTRRPGDDRSRRQARPGRSPIRRSPGRPRPDPRSRPTWPRIRRLGQALRAWNPSSTPSAAWRPRGPSWPARASFATRRMRATSSRRWPAMRSSGSRPTRPACSTT